MSDFKETLEVSKNSTCFLSFSWCRIKEDLATEEGMLPNPPLEIEFEQEATVAEVAELLDGFCETADKASRAIDALLNNGHVTVVEEY
jgi:hypothetical protein